MKGWVSITEAARIKNVTRQAIYVAIRLKRLKAYKDNDVLKVFLVDLKEYDSRKYSREYHSFIDGKPIFDESKGYFSVDKASVRINVPVQKLYYAIRSGKLKASRKNAAWVIHVSDLMQYHSRYLNNYFTAQSA